MRFVIYLFLTIGFSSCLTQKRVVYNYLEDIKDSASKRSVFIAEPIIQKNDLLSIQVSSISTDKLVDPMYNMPVQATAGSQNAQVSGYLVDVRGNIEMPRIGTIHAEGLTKSEFEQVIRSKLKDVLTQPTIMVRFLNFRITVLGEVGNPGVLTIPTERLTILEAVGMAGGITEFGTIKNVRVLRENNGVRETGLLDLTSQSIFGSRYYQLQQNDVVLVDQSNYRLRQEEQQLITQRITFALSIITSLTLIYSVFTRN